MPTFLVIVGLVAAFLVLSVGAVLIQEWNVTGQPETVVLIANGLKLVLTATPVAMAIGVGRNLVGYAVNWIRAKREGDEAAEYSSKWLLETVVKFEGWIVVITPLIELIAQYLPGEKKMTVLVIAGAVFATIDMLFSEIKKLLKDTNGS